MANHNKNKKFEKGGFKMDTDGVLHRPKRSHAHIAREIMDTHGPQEAEHFVRQLLPHMRDRVLGYPEGSSKYPGWHPSFGRQLIDIKNLRGGMIG